MKVRISLKREADLKTNRVGIVKEFRQITSCGLKEAVDFINHHNGPQEIEVHLCNTINLLYWNVEEVQTCVPVVKEETSVDRLKTVAKTVAKDFVDEGRYNLAIDLLILLRDNDL